MKNLIKAYIINLERSVERREYMENILKGLPFLSPEFVKAVDGRAMSMEERRGAFDDDLFQKRNSNVARPGEVGCTLSHQKCYRKIVEENEPYVLILEDDIRMSECVEIGKVMARIDDMMRTDEPLIILLSGWYWYWRTSSLTDNYKLASVYDAFLTHSYVINQAAARLLIEERPSTFADDWTYIRRKNIRLRAVFPHLIEQNWDGNLATTVNVEQNKRKNISWYLRNFVRLFILKALFLCNHFEKA